MGCRRGSVAVVEAQTAQAETLPGAVSGRRRGLPAFAVGALAVGGAVMVIVGAALPWLDLGGVKRSAFTMARIANELGVLDTSERKFAVRALLVTPIIASLVVLLLGLGRVRLAGLVGLPLGVAGLGAGTIGTRFSPTTPAGPYVCLVGGAIGILGAWGLLLSPRVKPVVATDQPNSLGFTIERVDNASGPALFASTTTISGTESHPALVEGNEAAQTKEIE